MRRFKWVGPEEPIAPTRYAFTAPNSAGNVFIEIDDTTDAGRREADGLALNPNFEETKTSQKQASEQGGTSSQSSSAQPTQEGVPQ